MEDGFTAKFSSRAAWRTVYGAMKIRRRQLLTLWSAKQQRFPKDPRWTFFRLTCVSTLSEYDRLWGGSIQEANNVKALIKSL